MIIYSQLRRHTLTEGTMSAITGISGFNRYTNYPGIYSNPSDAAIAEKTEAQVRGIDQGTENLRDANSVT